MTWLKWIGSGLLGLLVAFAGATWYALEGHDVAVLRTLDPAGASLHSTRVWVSEEGTDLWVEAATAERAWYRDLLANPTVEVVRHGRVHRYVARPHPGASGHRRIRAMLRAKYGLADVWVGLLQDTSRSVAIQLTPLPVLGTRV